MDGSCRDAATYTSESAVESQPRNMTRRKAGRSGTSRRDLSHFAQRISHFAQSGTCGGISPMLPEADLSHGRPFDTWIGLQVVPPRLAYETARAPISNLYAVMEHYRVRPRQQRRLRWRIGHHR
jgi:hypothetical protein